MGVLEFGSLGTSHCKNGIAWRNAIVISSTPNADAQRFSDGEALAQVFPIGRHQSLKWYWPLRFVGLKQDRPIGQKPGTEGLNEPLIQGTTVPSNHCHIGVR